nr:hypothetical protein [Micromonospora sp. DSM 115978]
MSDGYAGAGLVSGGQGAGGTGVRRQGAGRTGAGVVGPVPGFAVAVEAVRCPTDVPTGGGSGRGGWECVRVGSV